jgi:hypothetical protein
VREQLPQHLGVAVKRGPPERLPARHPPRQRIESEIEHQRHGARVIRMRAVGDETHLIARETRDDPRMRSNERLGGCAIALRAGGEQTLRRRRVTP